VGIVFDTNIWIAYKPKALPKSLLMSVVVLQELIAGAPDGEGIKKYEAAQRYYERENRLLVPTAEDWILAGKTLNALLRGLRSHKDGLIPRLHPNQKQRIVRDVLIARSVRRVNGLLVTDNRDDFNQIKKFCNARIESASEFFGL
jgi:predicted nucleic acid-binding protein